MIINIKPKETTAIINSLIAGVVPKIGVQHITVGRTKEVDTFISALEEVKSGHSMVKFWVGDFGSGKSFMLHLLNTVALKQKFVVTNADFTPHSRLYSNDGKSQKLYTALMDNIAIQTKPEGGALAILLEKWIEQIIFQTAQELQIPIIEIRSPEYIGIIQNNIMKTVNEITETGGFDFGLAINRYYEGFINSNDELRKNALRWLKGEYTTKTEAKNDLGISDIINDRNYYEMLKNFGKLFIKTGYSGFVINLDEAINLYKISNKGMRQKNYETLLSVYNDCFQGKVEQIFFNIAGTTEVLEDEERGLYSYEALKSRLKVNKFEKAGLRDYSQPVIRLMPLNNNEIFVLLKKLKSIFDQNYTTDLVFPDSDILHFMEEIYNKPGASDFLTPREVIRDFLNILNIIRQNPDVDKEQLFKEIQIVDERPSTLEQEEVLQKEKLERAQKQTKKFNLNADVAEKIFNTLMDEENILKVIPGSLKNRAGSLLATENRLIFIDKKLEIASFPYSQINEMYYTKGVQTSTLHFLLGNEKLSIDFLPNSQIRPLVDLLEAQIDILERKTLSAELQFWEKGIANPEVKKNLGKMNKIAFLIQEKDSIAGEIFFKRHSDTIIKLLKQYRELEAAGMENTEIISSMQRIEEAIDVIRSAFEKELQNMFQTDMLDIDAESAAYIQSLKNRGLV